MAKKKVAIAQISAKQGDLDYNTNKVIKIIKEHGDADILIFPELILQNIPNIPRFLQTIGQRQSAIILAI